jgi:hypothetical protein
MIIFYVADRNVISAVLPEDESEPSSSSTGTFGSPIVRPTSSRATQLWSVLFKKKWSLFARV